SLRIGILLNSREKISASLARIIADIQASNFAEIKLSIVKKSTSAPANSSNSGVSRFLRPVLNPKVRRQLLYSLYLRLDARMKPTPDPLAEIDCKDLLGGIETIEVEPVGQKFVHRFPEEALEQIRARNLDVLMRFGFNILHGGILKTAR